MKNDTEKIATKLVQKSKNNNSFRFLHMLLCIIVMINISYYLSTITFKKADNYLFLD